MNKKIMNKLSILMAIAVIFTPLKLEVFAEDTDMVNNGVSETKTTEISLSAEEEAITGNYSTLFHNMNFPLTVQRGYGSWNFSTTAATLTESGVPGDGWKQSVKNGSFGMKLYYFTEDYKHEVTIDWGDGRVEKFTMVPSPNQQAYYPLQYIDKINYVVQGSSKSKLEAIGNDKNLIFNSDGLYDYNFSIYNPKQYKLTTLDGTIYIFDDEEGIQEIQDPLGNVTFQAAYE